MGALYLFREDTANTSFLRVLYEATGGRGYRAMKRASRPKGTASRFGTPGSWNAKQSAMLRKSRVLDVTIQSDRSQ